MRILYFGTVCDLKEYEKMLAGGREKASIAPIVFESSLLSGFRQNGIEMDVYSFPLIPMFPRSKWLWWGSKKEQLACGYACTWLKTINLPIIKQFSRRLHGRHILKKWLKEHRGEECAVLSYSIPPFLVKDIVCLSRKYGVKCFALVTDLLRDMYVNAQDNSFVMFLKNHYLSQAIQWQGEYDGYVLLTEAMSEVINPEKPYIVMEGIADVSDVSLEETSEKAVPAGIMYAGLIEEKFGILSLLDAFEDAALPDTELWLFGHGNAADIVAERAERNSKIRFFGRKLREEIQEFEKKASLLVNPRNVSDEFTRYSFPSKTIEYMLSGTPTLTTKLRGIPEEYYPFLLLCEDNDRASLKQALISAMSLSAEEREERGQRAKQFIVEKKNATKQVGRVVQFIAEGLKL